MHTVDYFFLIFSAVIALGCIHMHGWTTTGIGPAILSLAGGICHFWFQWLRHRNWLRHKDDGGAPGTLHLALLAQVGLLVPWVLALLWLIWGRLHS